VRVVLDELAAVAARPPATPRSRRKKRGGGMPLASRSVSDLPADVADVAAASGSAVLLVFGGQARSRMAFRKLAADQPVSGLCSAPRRDARMVPFPARPAVEAYRTVRVIQP